MNKVTQSIYKKKVDSLEQGGGGSKKYYHNVVVTISLGTLSYDIAILMSTNSEADVTSDDILSYLSNLPSGAYHPVNTVNTTLPTATRVTYCTFVLGVFVQNGKLASVAISSVTEGYQQSTTTHWSGFTIKYQYLI